jgi:hypothetical protein
LSRSGCPRAARIPAIKAALHLSPGILGLCLLGPAAGSVLTMPLAGPALIGGVAQAIGLHAALGIDVILCAMCAALAGFVRPRAAPGGR